ncbi:ParA family protein [Cytobacillus depressus]|uniref:ParA family protein n=1 Tax=Cytobacillus depressus TaxID=1602942 RepID=A0A6L3V0I2_9BACI|nr:ParA family protein [Cytobacillus depressus]KAB2328967.1 ParA family protein [Cytobacillus depressus]
MGEKRAKVITVGVQKGGVGKSTTSGVLSYLLSQDGYKVLVVDMDSQSNVTDLLTQKDVEDFQGMTVLEAFEDGSVEDYIYQVNENLHVVPSDDYLATLAKNLYRKWKHFDDVNTALKEILEPVIYDYDFIIIDTPPSLSEPMVNAICASDYVLVLAESSKWSMTAVPRFLETVEYAQQNINPNLKVLGILRTMNDVRRADSKAFVELIKEFWPDLCFDVVIRRKAATGRISMEGLFDNNELASALEQYKIFYKELKQRVEG